MSIQGLKVPHIGKKIERIREIKGMKQETLASKIGVSQQTISRIEQSETVENDTLEKIAAALEIPVEGIKNFSEEAFFNIICNTFHNTSSDNSTLIASALNYQPTFNTIEKIVELYELLLKEKDKVIKMYEAGQKAS